MYLNLDIMFFITNGLTIWLQGLDDGEFNTPYTPVNTSDGSVEYMLSRRSSDPIGP